MPTGNLPPKAKRQWEHVYESAKSRGFSESRAAQQAWGAVKLGYVKVGDRWVRRTSAAGRRRKVTHVIGKRVV